MVQLYSRVSRSLALPISTMPRFIIPLADKLNSSICGMPATFARNSTATYIDPNGVLQAAAIGVPRFQNGRYLVEPAATNLFLQSGTPATQTITVVSGSVYTVQCFGTGNITLSGAGSGTVVNGTPVTFTASSTSVTCTVAGTLSRAQVELGSKATSYIPTTSAPATRAADVLHYDVSSVITQGQGSLYCEFWDGNYDGTIRRLLNISDGTNFNRISPTIKDIGGITVIGVYAGSFVISAGTGNVLSTLNKLLLSYENNSVKLYLNGVLIGSDTACTIPTNFTTLSIGCSHDAVLQLNSEIGNVKYFKEVLTEAEAIKLTTV